MIAVGVANVFLLVCVVWVVWERRLTFGSRFDSPITIGTVLFGAGVGLTSPWPVVAGFPFPFTGKYFAMDRTCQLTVLILRQHFLSGQRSKSV
jgi:glucose dehydrogenase